MRTLLVCCLAVLAVAANVPKPFKASQTYVYRFDTQVASSLIASGPAETQQAATRLRAEALLSFKSERHFNLQIRGIRFGELNSELPKSQRVQPFEHFERRDIPVEVKQQLELPLSVSYVDGVVERINFHEDDSVWSKNIKRAVLNMLQLNLKRNDVQGLKMQSSIVMSEQEEKEMQVFSVPEITLEGECETVYSIQQKQSYGSDDEMTPFNVTKTINFNKCEKTSDVNFGYQPNPAEQLRCLNCLRQQQTQQQNAQARELARFTHCQQECQPSKVNEDKDVERSTFARYELVGKQQGKYSIKKVSMISNYIVKAQNPASQNTLVQITSLSELTFKETLETSPIQAAKPSSMEESLLYDSDYDRKEKKFYMYGDEESEKSSPFAKVEKKEQKVAHSIRNILQQWSDKKNGYEMNSALNFHKIVEVIRQSTRNEIQRIEQVMIQVAKEQQGDQQSNEKLAKTLFLDALASAATQNSLKVLEHKITKREISAVKAVQLLKIYTSSAHSPSTSQADLLEKIAKSDVAQQSKPLQQAAWLSFGQIVGAICQDRPAQAQKALFRVETLCPQGKKDQYKKTLMSNWQRSESTYEQIIALKTIGNAALDNTVEELQKIVKDKQEPTLVRMEAIDAMRRLRTGHVQKIRQVLLPIFQNQRELPEVRMAAFSMLMYTHPEKSILDQLVFTTINDRSQNVKSFVLTTMESLARSPSSAEQEAANHMKSALKMVRMQPEELRSSRKYRVPIYVSEQQDTEEQNLFLGLASIVSPTNMLPIHLSSSLRSAFNGEATEENIQLSFSQKNLELYGEKISEFIQKYMNADNEQDRDQDTMERQSAKDLRQIYSSLGIKNRRVGSYYLDSDESSEKMPNKKIGESQPFGMIVLRVNDVDQVIVPISEQQLPQLVQKLLKGEKPLMSSYDELSQQLAGGQHFRQHIGIVAQEKRTKIPTTSGLPLVLTRQTSVLGSIEGELKARFESERLESSRGLTAELRFRSSGIASHQHKVSVWSPVVVSGVETTRTVELNLPVIMKARFAGQKVEIKAIMLQEDVRFAALHTLPITFTRQFDIKTRTEREPRVKAIQNWALEHTQQEFQRENQDAIHLEGHLHRPTTLKQWIQALYTTENNVHAYYRPNERTPKELTLRIISDVFQKHSQHSRPEMESFYHSSPSKNFRQIYDEDFEGMNLDKDEQRRERFSTYSKQYEQKDAYKHKIRVEAEAHCGQKTHKVSAEFNGACDARLQHCKIFVDAERTPLHNENRPWKLNAKIQTVAPESISEESHMETKHSRMLIQMESEWGSDKQNVMNIKIQAEPTKKTYWKPESQQKWSQFLNKIDMVAEYKLHSAQKNVVQRAYELGKATYFWQLEVEERRSNDGEGLVRATIVIDPITRRHANLSIQTPTERLRIQQIDLPIRLAPYNLQRRSQQYRSFGHLISSVTNFGGAQCKVDDRRVETFDGVSYRAPMSDCWSVLAKDCSREQPRFAVLMKKQSEEEKKVKIVLQDKTIELIGKQQQKPIVKIDGQRVESEQDLSEDGIEMTYNTIYVKRSGLNVQFDGEQVKIQLSGMYKSLQCGLCAHYNEEDTDTFRMANNERSNSLKEFHKSYTMKNEECSESQLNKHYENSEEFEIERRQPSRRQQKNSWFESEESSEEKHYDNDEERWDQSRESRRTGPKPIKRTKIVEYSHKLCFSTEPVKRCPKGSRPDEEAKTEDVTVKYFCLERQSTQARRLQRQVRQGEIVDSSPFQPSFNEEIAQPTKCVEAY